MKPGISLAVAHFVSVFLVFSNLGQAAEPAAEGQQKAADPKNSPNATTKFAEVARNPEIEKLIDKLIDVAEPGFGYSAYFSGSEFLPYEGTGEVSTLILGAGRSARSDALREIVRSGAAAGPSLLKHIHDKRTIKMEPLSGMMWMDFSDEYDFNRRTRTTPVPKGVNRDDFGRDRNDPNQHAVTVGDLCFVALGQIVNRRFNATRYQPTGGLIVSSPTYSEALRSNILKDWGSLTPQSHKQLLIDDFLKPDYSDRRVGAYLRLSLYYPDAVEKLVVDELSRPTFDEPIVDEFCRNTLYKANSPAARKAEYDMFVRTHGQAFAAGIQDELFDDLRFRDDSSRPRQLLAELFGWPADVKPDDRPPSDAASESEQAQLIARLIHDDSRKIGDIVKALFLKNSDDDYFATACLRCLANRGYTEFLLEQLQKIDPADRQANRLHENYLQAISTSRDPKVREALFAILTRSANEAYFMASLPAADRSEDKVVVDAARKLLARLPDDSKDGEGLLQMIGKRAPDEAKEVFNWFLANGSANRAATMCNVLWYGHPLAPEILAPLLNDKRKLGGFAVSMRVCDRAATAISQASEDIQFDSDWSIEVKDQQIEKLKQFCRAKAGAPK